MITTDSPASFSSNVNIDKFTSKSKDKGRKEKAKRIYEEIIKRPIYLVIDGSFLLNRAHVMLKGTLFNAAGEETGALYNAVYAIMNYMKIFRPRETHVTVDIGRSKRHAKLYKNYKVEREAAKAVLPGAREDKEAYLSQRKKFCDFLFISGIREYVIPYVEADGIIGYVVQLLENKIEDDAIIMIASSDKDFLQLIRDGRVIMMNPVENVFYTEEDIIWKLKLDGIATLIPEQVPAIRAILGDKSDSIPKVKNVGEKAIIKLVNRMTEADLTIRTQEDILNFIKKEDEEGTIDRIGKLILDHEQLINTNMELMDLIRIDERLSEHSKHEIRKRFEKERHLLKRDLQIFCLKEEFDSFIRAFPLITKLLEAHA